MGIHSPGTHQRVSTQLTDSFHPTSPYLSCQGRVGIVEVSADASQPNVTTIGEVLCGIHLKHLTHVHHLCLTLLTRKVNGSTRLQRETCMFQSTCL